MATVPYNGFEKGFITEGNPLQYPEGATKDEINFDLLQDGTRVKRLGMDIEAQGNKIGQGASDVSSTYLWDTQIDGTKLVVAQLDLDLYVWDAKNNPVSKNKPYKFATISDRFTRQVRKPPVLSFSSGNGYLIAVGDSVKPMYFLYKGKFTDATIDGVFTYPYIEQGDIDIRIRDFVGVDDNLATDTRPGSLSAAHRYNLQNQGWEIKDTYL